jgi:DNA-binding Lrp family transcriptional regulator
MDSRSVDDLDRAIIAALQLNGRAPWHQIAAHVQAEPRTAMRRAARLEEAGLLRVIGVVDVLRCGLGVPALVRYTCRPGAAEDVAHRLTEKPQTRFVTVVAGQADCVAETVVSDYRELGRSRAPDPGHAADVLETESLPVMHTFTSAHDWNPGVLTDEAARALRPGGGAQQPFEDRFWEQAPETLDETDLGIVRVLAASGRAAYKEIAQQTGCSERTAARRTESLVERGCLRFRTLAEPEVLGYGVEFILWLSVDPAQLDAAGTILATHPATKYLSATTGRFNLVGQIALRHHGELYPYTIDVVGGLPGVRASDVTLQTRTLKRAWTPTPAASRGLTGSPPPAHGPLPPATGGTNGAASGSAPAPAARPHDSLEGDAHR